MTHREGTFTGASGGESYWQAWVPDEPKAGIATRPAPRMRSFAEDFC